MNLIPNMFYFEQNALYQNLLYPSNENSADQYFNRQIYPNYFYPIVGYPIFSYIPTNTCNNLNPENDDCPIESENAKTKRKKFSREEDEKLKTLVDKMGCKNWNNIAKYMSGRSGRQCRDRYQNYLCPGFSNGHWTKEEDELLICKYNQIGSQWSKMVMFFKNRNANALKNRWYYYLSKQKDNINNDIIDNKSNDNDIKHHDEISGINSIIDYAFSLNFIDQLNEKPDLNSKIE